MRDIAVLAKAFGLEEPALMSEIDDLAPIAKQHQVSTNASNLDCWIAAVRKVESRPSTHKSHPTAAVRECLYRLAMFRPCTSRVEQDFSRIDELLSTKRLNGLASTEDDVAKVILDTPQDPDTRAHTIQAARQAWRECFGVCRPGHRERRIDVGVSKK